jgi:hypothetical protein
MLASWQGPWFTATVTHAPPVLLSRAVGWTRRAKLASGRNSSALPAPGGAPVAGAAPAAPAGAVVVAVADPTDVWFRSQQASARAGAATTLHGRSASMSQLPSTTAHGAGAHGRATSLQSVLVGGGAAPGESHRHRRSAEKVVLATALAAHHQRASSGGGGGAASSSSAKAAAPAPRTTPADAAAPTSGQPRAPTWITPPWYNRWMSALHPMLYSAGMAACGTATIVLLKATLALALMAAAPPVASGGDGSGAIGTGKLAALTFLAACATVALFVWGQYLQRMAVNLFDPVLVLPLHNCLSLLACISVGWTVYRAVAPRLAAISPISDAVDSALAVACVLAVLVVSDQPSPATSMPRRLLLVQRSSSGSQSTSSASTTSSTSGAGSGAPASIAAAARPPIPSDRSTASFFALFSASSPASDSSAAFLRPGWQESLLLHGSLSPAPVARQRGSPSALPQLPPPQAAPAHQHRPTSSRTLTAGRPRASTAGAVPGAAPTTAAHSQPPWTRGKDTTRAPPTAGAAAFVPAAPGHAGSRGDATSALPSRPRPALHVEIPGVA